MRKEAPSVPVKDAPYPLLPSKKEKTLPEKASSKIAQNQFIAINYNIHSCKTLAELIQFSFNYFLQVHSVPVSGTLNHGL